MSDPTHIPESRSSLAGSDLPASLLPLSTQNKYGNYFLSFLVVAVLTLLGFSLRQTLDTATIAMFYLLALVGIAVWLGRGPAIAASFLGVLALDYFINPPYFSFAITRFQNWMTLILMLVESLVISTLAARLKQRVQWAREREAFTSLLYDLGQALAQEGDERLLFSKIETFLSSAVDGNVSVLLTDAIGRLQVAHPFESPWENEAAYCTYIQGRITGLGYGSYPRSRKLYLPLSSPARVLGVLAFDFHDPYKGFSIDQLRRLEGYAGQVTTALERALLYKKAESHRISAENEKNRSALLSAVSHDLRTPLTTIMGAASGLIEDKGSLNPEERLQLTRSIHSEAERLKHLVQNLLDMTRLQGGALVPKKEWQSVEELVGVALDRLKLSLSDHPLTIQIEPDLPLILVDGLLIEQLLLNLLENAAKHTAPGTPVQLKARTFESGVEVEVSDQGPGVNPGEEKIIFEKFMRGYHSGQGGAGLGLAICEGIAQAHGGSIKAQNRPGGGASFIFWLPTGGTPPPIED